MEPRQRRTATRWIAPFACLLLVLPLAGCSIPSSRTMAAIPSEWRDRHPFGPDGNAARERGEWHVSCKPEEMAQHTAFAVEHIHEGDVLFRRGHSYHIPTRVGCWILTKVNNGRYSHVALAHWEGSQLWVYDVESQGTRKVPFEVWMLDVVGSDFAVKRLKPEYRDRIPKAIAFCEDAYRRKVPFDFSFAPSDERYYCSELVEKAFRSAGLTLSQPLPIRNMPGFKNFWYLEYPAKWCMGIQVEKPVFAPGNEYYGVFGSPRLEPVYEGPETGSRTPEPPEPIVEEQPPALPEKPVQE